MIYKVIGLMSGSSLDGVDIIYATIVNTAQKWEYTIEKATTIPYDNAWLTKLKQYPNVTLTEFATQHTEYGRYLGQLINEFIAKNELDHKVHFIATHGHTVFHAPQLQTSVQLGDGSSIAATTGITTISELRQMDLAFGGQGAPIVPIADQLLFADYKYCLNLGGIANISIKENSDIKAFDIAAANQALNHFAQLIGKDYDDQGALAAQGVADDSVLEQLHQNEYFHLTGAKSLSNDFSTLNIIPKLAELSIEDALNTACKHIVAEIKHAIHQYPLSPEPTKMLVTGGGAFNNYLMLCLQEALQPLQIEIIKPENELVAYKEALAMALIGVLRWREETNVHASVTGASTDSVGGALWLAQ